MLKMVKPTQARTRTLETSLSFVPLTPYSCCNLNIDILASLNNYTMFNPDDEARPPPPDTAQPPPPDAAQLHPPPLTLPSCIPPPHTPCRRCSAGAPSQC
ncbi:hypothetical protein Pmani_008623 [Petrolisthes manimaculis]|uniref:Uncharacterized protein n=1 Tax=Petrolisthes manimaculis TaxID=1843537 RepID=A0AAE1Q592_9EUCA|nr:hypothetical protein Pmani_008623 [Petrolisthes manimaculis]